MGLKRVTWGQNHVSAFRPTGCRVTLKHVVPYSGSSREQKDEENEEDEEEEDGKKEIYRVPWSRAAALVRRLSFKLAN
jgi:hypothetical protein